MEDLTAHLKFKATAVCVIVAASVATAVAQLPASRAAARNLPNGPLLNQAAQFVSTAAQGTEKGTKLEWFDAAKYGLFINWGLYAIPAGEWQGKKYGGIGEWLMHDARIPVKEYELLAKQFNPGKFNAEEWAQLAEDAGMKYLVFDCNHHDGFALFHSQVSKYNCYDATPWQRDPMKELQAACSKHHLKLCF